MREKPRAPSGTRRSRKPASLQLSPRPCRSVRFDSHVFAAPIYREAHSPGWSPGHEPKSTGMTPVGRRALPAWATHGAIPERFELLNNRADVIAEGVELLHPSPLDHIGHAGRSWCYEERSHADVAVVASLCGKGAGEAQASNLIVGDIVRTKGMVWDRMATEALGWRQGQPSRVYLFSEAVGDLELESL
jgi:hypothetical protein